VAGFKKRERQQSGSSRRGNSRLTADGLLPLMWEAARRAPGATDAFPEKTIYAKGKIGQLPHSWPGHDEAGGAGR